MDCLDQQILHTRKTLKKRVSVVCQELSFVHFQTYIHTNPLYNIELEIEKRQIFRFGQRGKQIVTGLQTFILKSELQLSTNVLQWKVN